MAHALIRTNRTGQPFRGRCIKCGAVDMRMSEGAADCPADDIMSDKDALFHILDSQTGEDG
jgi:hypothetical protein